MLFYNIITFYFCDNVKKSQKTAKKTADDYRAEIGKYHDRHRER